MIGLIIEIIVSFFILKYASHQNLEVLGLRPNKRRFLYLVIGIAWPIFYYCVYRFTVAWLVHNPYILNPEYHFTDFINATAYVARAVGFEELIFRGALLYLLLQKTSAQKAMIISASAFGIYHWFAWQAFGNPVQMLMVFFMTASAGYVFAMAFVRTGSMYLSFAIHFGNNMANMILFSQDKSIGLQLLLKSYPVDPFVPGPFISLPVLVIHFIGFQLLTYLILRKCYKADGL